MAKHRRWGTHWTVKDIGHTANKTRWGTHLWQKGIWQDLGHRGHPWTYSNTVRHITNTKADPLNNAALILPKTELLLVLNVIPNSDSQECQLIS